MSIFEGVELNTMQFIGPLILLFICITIAGFVYSRLFRWLPKEIYNYLIGPALLIGAYIWYEPMNLGFYELFK